MLFRSAGYAGFNSNAQTGIPCVYNLDSGADANSTGCYRERGLCGNRCWNGRGRGGEYNCSGPRPGGRAWISAKQPDAPDYREDDGPNEHDEASPLSDIGSFESVSRHNLIIRILNC